MTVQVGVTHEAKKKKNPCATLSYHFDTQASQMLLQANPNLSTDIGLALRQRYLLDIIA